MKGTALQENLRKILLQRIKWGALTGVALAQQTGFGQSHLSNFLNRKRGLSLEGMAKILSVQQLSVLDLLDPAEVNRRASILPPSNDEFDNVLLIKSSIAATRPLVTADQVLAVFKSKKSFLRQINPETDVSRSSWHRFVLIWLDAHDAIAMFPRLRVGATLLIDRHYNSLKSYRKGDFNMYAVLKDDTCTIRYVERAGNHLLLRPHNNDSFPLEAIRIAEGRSAADYLVGRVCQVALET
jgi:hypothetical protein